MSSLAAIPYRSGFGIDALMLDLVVRLRQRGLRLGGVVQHNDPDCADRCMAMSLEDLGNGTRFPISQDLGAAAQGCRLDANGLAAATTAFADALEGRADLVLVNRFGKQEAMGEGLRDEVAKAVIAGLPTLVPVRQDFLPAWRDFAGEDWIELPAEAPAAERWALDAVRIVA